MKIAEYRTHKGAQRYANEIVAQFPNCQAIVVTHPRTFNLAVLVTTGDGRKAYAGKRPNHYATKINFEASRNPNLPPRFGLKIVM